MCSYLQNFKHKSVNKIILLVPLMIILSLSSKATPKTEVRQKILFNQDWKFSLSDQPQYRDSDFNDGLWRILNLPHDWSIEGDIDQSVDGSGGFFPIGIGWYRKTFILPKSMKDKQLILQFDGIYMNSEVWINGQFLGRHPYGFTMLQYDLTDFIKSGKGEVNTIAFELIIRRKSQPVGTQVQVFTVMYG